MDTDRQTDRQAGRQADGRTDGQTDRRTDGQADRQTGEQDHVLSQANALTKKEHLSSSKIDKIRAYFRNLSKFHEKIAKILHKIL